MDYSHLHALEIRLSHERDRLVTSTGRDRELRLVWVRQIEKEITEERKRLGIPDPVEVSDDELLRELGL